MINKVVNTFIDIDWLQDNKLVVEYSSLHYKPDLDIIIKKMTNLKSVFNYLDTKELMIIKEYWGSEIAH